MTNKNFFAGVLAAFALTFTSSANAYPVYAQNGYENPREATGRIVCANCHLAQKPVDIEVPQAVLPNSVFEAVVKIPYDQEVKQVLGNGKKRWVKCWGCAHSSRWIHNGTSRPYVYRA